MTFLRLVVSDDEYLNDPTFGQSIAKIVSADEAAKVLDSIRALRWVYERNECTEEQIVEATLFLLELRKKFPALFGEFAKYMWQQGMSGTLDIAALKNGDTKRWMTGGLIGPLETVVDDLAAKYDDEVIASFPSQWFTTFGKSLCKTLSACERITLHALTGYPRVARGEAVVTVATEANQHAMGAVGKTA